MPRAWTAVGLGAAVGASVVAAGAVNRAAHAADAPNTAAAMTLTDVSRASGIDFVHRNGATGEKFACELLGAGGALLDFDGDGDLDLYLVQGAALPGADYDPPPRDELWQNLGGGTAPQFRRVPDAAGAGDPGYGMGAAVGDVDNDGDPDLYVTNFGPDVLYRNEGGRFTDVTRSAGLGDARWSTSAAFFDADGDGFLDLYVCNYFQYRVEDHDWYGLRKPGYRTHGGPAMFRPDADVFYRNRGDGTFEDATEAAGFAAAAPSHGLGIVAGDFDDDRDVDVFVANDTQPNFLFLNDGAGRFTEEAMLAGVATDPAGKPRAGMGVDAQDADGDGRIDLLVTNFSLETNAFFRAEGGGFFTDAAFEVGLGAPSLPFLGFGTGFFDPDNDRDLDVFVANGHIFDNVPLYFDNLTYKQRNQLFRNEGGRFVEADRSLGPAVTREEASRAAIFGDLDDDGDTDLIVTDVATSPQVLRNDGGDANGWVRVTLRGTRSNRDGYGAEVLVTAKGVTRRLQARAAYGYLASNDPRVLAGLGGAAEAERIEVRWPSGIVDVLEHVPSASSVVVVEGEG